MTVITGRHLFAAVSVTNPAWIDGSRFHAILEFWGIESMGKPPINALGSAVQNLPRSSISLDLRLRNIAEELRLTDGDYCDAVDVFVDRLARSGAGRAAPQVGERMPGFILPDEQGRLLSLDILLERAPVILAFHRGHWCPFCRMNAAGLAEIEPVVAPVQIVAISAETQAYTKAIKAGSGAKFPFLTDVGNGYALSLGLAVVMDDTLAAMLAEDGDDIPRYQGQEGWIMPIPSVFVVGRDGIISARHIDPDFRRRMDLDDLCAAAKAVLA
jgi:peroxiredoxin